MRDRRLSSFDVDEPLAARIPASKDAGRRSATLVEIDREIVDQRFAIFPRSVHCVSFISRSATCRLRNMQMLYRYLTVNHRCD